MLRKVVVDDESIAARVAEIFTYGNTGKWCIVAHGSTVGCCCGYHHGIRHSSVHGQLVHNRCHGRCLLSDGYIYTIHWLSGFIISLLVDDGIDGNGCLTYLAVANDKLALSTAYWHHRVDGLDTCLKWLLHRLAEDYARSLALQWQAYQIAIDRSLAVDGVTKHVDYASQQTLAHGN